MRPERLAQIKQRIAEEQAEKEGSVSPHWAVSIAPELVAEIERLNERCAFLRSSYEAARKQIREMQSGVMF